MISEERIQCMTKLEAFEEQEEHKAFPVANYTQSDYRDLMIMRYFILGTIAYAVILFSYLYLQFMNGKLDATTDYLTNMLVIAGIAYVVFMAIYLFISVRVSMKRFRKKKARIKKYRTKLKELLELYRTDERIKKEMTMTHAQMWGVELEEEHK